MRVVLITFAFLLMSASAIGKTINLRNKSDSDGGVREISFCARPSPATTGLPGHAFVVFAQTALGGKSKFRAIGHTVFSVGDAILSYKGIIPANGALVNENYTAIKQECLTVQVNASEFETTYLDTTQPLAVLGIKFDEKHPIQKSYSLSENDCMDFMLNIANRYKVKGINIPKRNQSDLPLPYLRKLIEAN
ncbi:hypothetical protein [Rheinheimera tilapiae]|uniref:Uncharacterized protein n=1 Tax=Rheinheimera tilapiae TaxID=875043 RepID=A0ABV6BCI4_9GAMM